MDDLSLEKEFSIYASISKKRLVKALLMDYYMTIELSQVNIPAFQRTDDTPEAKADREIISMLLDGDNLKRFNATYEKAYELLDKAGILR